MTMGASSIFLALVHATIRTEMQRKILKLKKILAEAIAESFVDSLCTKIGIGSFCVEI
jgi:hypothetical protein